MSADVAGRRFGPDSQFCFGTTKLLIQLVLLLFFLPSIQGRVLRIAATPFVPDYVV